MVLSECSIGFFTLFFTMLKVSWENIGWVLSGVIVLGILASSEWLFVGFLEVISLLDDFASNLTLFSGGLAGFFGTFFLSAALSILLGVGWMIIALTSKANIVLKAIASPIFFLAGVGWGFFPWSIPGLNIGLYAAARNKNVANALCILAIALIIASIFLFGNWLCVFTNYLTQFLL